MIDATTWTAVAICDHCGNRETLRDRDRARTWLANHEATEHPGKDSAQMTRRQARRRALLLEIQ